MVVCGLFASGLPVGILGFVGCVEFGWVGLVFVIDCHDSEFVVFRGLGWGVS